MNSVDCSLIVSLSDEGHSLFDEMRIPPNVTARSSST
jgi:hypothetical protein